MICPKCAVQTVQHKGKGDGLAQEEFYMTWTIQKCPKCKQKFMEFYAVQFVLNENEKPNFSIGDAETY